MGGSGPAASVWLDAAREYTEFWVHQQQVRDAVGRPGANSGRLTWPVVDTFLRAVPHALRHLSPAPACTSMWPAWRRQLDGPSAGRHLSGELWLAGAAGRCVRPALL